jgi:Flp pilus assembly protein TadG
MARLRQTPSTKFLARFCADRRGATAVEFAFVALPFFTLLFGIMQTSLVMFSAQALQTMTTIGSRKIMTGEMRGKSFSEFKTALCAASGLSGMFDCTKLMVQVQAANDFGTAHSQFKINDACFKIAPTPPSTCYVDSAREQVVIVHVAYDWPFAVNPEDLSHKSRINAVAAFTNEPF